MDPHLSGHSLRAWEELAAGAGTLPTQDAPWSIAALAALPGKPHILRSDDCAGIAPLVRDGGRLELAGARRLGEPADLLATSPDALAQLVDELAKTKLPIVLRRIPAESPTIAALQADRSRRARIQVAEAIACPTIELDERWTEPGGGLSSSRRSSLRRARRRAERYGAVVVALGVTRPAEVESLLDEAFAIEARSWKSEEGTALALVPEMGAFFRRYADELATRQALRIEILRIGGRGVAMQLGARWDNRHWLFKIGYDPAYAAASPGQLLLAESVAAAAREGLSRYELLGARESWTDVWTKDVRPCARVTVLPHNGRSMIAIGSLGWQGAEKRLGRGAWRSRSSIARTARESYVAGPELTDALREEGRYARAGFYTTVGFWNGLADSPDTVAAEATSAAEALGAGSEVSIKLPALGGGDSLDELLATCVERELTLHLDALQPDSATRSQETALRLAETASGRVGCTLPGRWGRSVADAEALTTTGMRVRIVKGEAPDSDDDERDPSEGFLEIVDALCGSNCHVEVATQDADLAETALERLITSGTSCELQVLHGMRSGAAVRAGRSLKVPVRVYVPYGTGRVPYAGEALRRHPALAMSFARDVLPLPSRRPALTAARISELLDFLPF